MRLAWLLVLALPLTAAASAESLSLKGLQLAVTVDDLPEHGDPIPGLSRLKIAQDVLAALKANKVPQAFGFCNNTPPEDAPILKAWLAAGYPLGNHTSTHPSLDKVGSEAFIKAIAKQDEQLKDYSPLPVRRTFRYPYLREGATLADRNAVRDYLKANGYRIAPVTVDYSDWAWTDAYQRCLMKKDEKTLWWLKQNAVPEALAILRKARKRSQEVMGRDVKHVLLIHVGAFDGVMLKGILTAYRSAGIKFIPLDEALSDPLYSIDPGVVIEKEDHGLFEQLAKSKGLPRGPKDDTVDRLNALCAD